MFFLRHLAAAMFVTACFLAICLPAANAASDRRVALVIGNSKYPDADQPLPLKRDAETLAGSLRAQGFEVELVENANYAQMRAASERLKARVQVGSTVVLYLGGYAVQSRDENYVIPTDAAIWTERDVRRQGFSIDGLLTELRERGANTRIALVDASRRNPYEEIQELFVFRSAFFRLG